MGLMDYVLLSFHAMFVLDSIVDTFLPRILDCMRIQQLSGHIYWPCDYVKLQTVLSQVDAAHYGKLPLASAIVNNERFKKTYLATIFLLNKVLNNA